MSPTSLALLSLLLLGSASAQYTPENAPETTEEGQTGTNKCGTESSQDSMCQNSYINSVSDFCLWAPPSTTSDYGDSAIGNTERIEVAWCVQSGHGTRVMPPGTITGAHFVKTPRYVQVTGTGDLTKLNIPAGDDGGELDPHGADGLGNPIGGLVFSSAFGGGVQQVTEWTNFMSSNAFSFKACMGDSAAADCQHIYDVMGAGWNAPGNYDSGFDDCDGDAIEAPGVYGTSTFHQGDASTPDAHAAGATSNCNAVNTIGGGAYAAATTTAAATRTSAAAASSSIAAAATSSVAPTTATSTSAAASSSAATSSAAESSSAVASSSSAIPSSSARASSSTSSRMASSSAPVRSATSSAVGRVSSAAAAASSAVTGGASSRFSGAWGVAAVVGVVGVVGGAIL